MRKNIILTISYDICVPLNVIGGSAELAMDTRDKKQSNNHLNNIRIVCRHITHLLNNLLDVYRLNEAKEARNDVPHQKTFSIFFLFENVQLTRNCFLIGNDLETSEVLTLVTFCIKSKERLI